MGRYLSQPLSVGCQTVGEVRKFLSSCRYVSDKQQFDKDEYWQPPEHFEQTKKGDCDDFALWTWRQFLPMEYDARFVVGLKGGRGHAWVTFQRNGKYYLVEPQYWIVGETFPCLSTVRFRPEFSVAWDGKKISFYSHQDLAHNLKVQQVPIFLFEWVIGWGYFWLRMLPRVPVGLIRRAFRKFAKLSGRAP